MDQELTQRINQMETFMGKLLQQQQQGSQVHHQQQQQLQQVLQQLHMEAQQAAGPAAQADDVDDSEEEMEQAQASWDLVLKSSKLIAQAPDSTSLIAMLAEPPPLEKLKGAEQDARHFQGVPETPGPRRHKVDYGLWQAQHKMEEAMHSVVAHLEGGDQKHLGLAAAWLRSAWQDLHEQRRALLAGWKVRNLLDKRPDDVRARLLTAQEEENVSKSRKPPDKAKNIWGSDPGPNPPRPPPPSGGFRGSPRSLSQPRSGKGKGKGAGNSF